jgi:hypothetical protein
MGHNLVAPPNVKGLLGQYTWINASTLLARKQFLERLFRGEESSARMLGAVNGEASITNDALMTGAVPNQERLQGALDPDKARQIRFMRAMERAMSSVQFDSDAWFAKFDPARGSTNRNGAATRLLLATAPQSVQDSDGDPLALVRALVLDAAYQLR